MEKDEKKILIKPEVEVTCFLSYAWQHLRAVEPERKIGSMDYSNNKFEQFKADEPTQGSLVGLKQLE